jgi:mRNA-degrading endonuclease RelE of RelBE toxin-antitoxin system
VEVIDKEISEIKINSVPKNTKDLCKNTKKIIRLRLGDYRLIGEYSPRLRLVIIVKYMVQGVHARAYTFTCNYFSFTY